MNNVQGGPAPAPPAIEAIAPSLPFVFGAPLGDNNSTVWMMFVKHYGPSHALDCTINFCDKDRKNVEHEWLTKHPTSPFFPLGMFDVSQVQVHVPSLGPEGAERSFQWTPLDPDRQHYSVSIDCRDGVFVEGLQVTRVAGILRASISIKHGARWIEKNPTLDPVVFTRQDAEFVSMPLLTEIPKSISAKKVHPGWKPNYPVIPPMAIIDPNGNVQVASIKYPDGVTRSGPGCWEILTKHAGDKLR